MRRGRDNSLKAAALVTNALQDLIHSHTETFEAMRAGCESPIEELFLAGLMAASFRHGDCVEFREGSPMNPPKITRPTCFQQVRVSDFRLDFLLVKPTPEGYQNIVIECDGHEFHERTPQDATRDRSRDRFFAARGYIVLRFTGTELAADPFKCGYEVLKMAVLSP